MNNARDKDAKVIFFLVDIPRDRFKINLMRKKSIVYLRISDCCAIRSLNVCINYRWL